MPMLWHFFFLKGCYFKASILYLITYLKRGKFNWNSPAQPVIVLNLIELPLSHHLHGFSWSFRRILNGVRQPKSMNRSTTDLQAEIPALVTPLYQSDWKLQEDTQYYQTLSDCVNTTDKNKPYWNNIWIYGAFYMEKNTHFAKVILPHTESASVTRGWIIFPCLQCLQAQVAHWSIWHWPFSISVSKGKALKAKCLLKTKHKHVLLKTVPQKIGLIYSGTKSGHPTSFSRVQLQGADWKRYKIHKPPNVSLLKHRAEIQMNEVDF